MNSISKLIVCDKRSSITKFEHAYAVRPSGFYGVKTLKTENLRGQGGNDGRIKGLSVNSLCRLRQAIAATRHEFEDYTIYGVCLTLPWGKKGENGKPLPGCPDQVVGSDVWKEFNKHLSRLFDHLSMGAIYRVELQEREAPHWHLMVYLPNDLDEQKSLKKMLKMGHARVPKSIFFTPSFYVKRNGHRRLIVSVGKNGKRSHYYALCSLRYLWAISCYRVHERLELRAMPASLLPSPVEGGREADIAQKPDTIETYDYCFDCFKIEDVLAGVGYLASHTSKHKQEQLGYVGKQWGFLGQKHLRSARGVAVKSFYSLTDRQRIACFRLIRAWCLKHRPKSMWLKVRPSKIVTPSGVEIFNGLTVRNHNRIYLFGLPDSVVSKAIAGACRG